MIVIETPPLWLSLITTFFQAPLNQCISVFHSSQLPTMTVVINWPVLPNFLTTPTMKTTTRSYLKQCMSIFTSQFFNGPLICSKICEPGDWFVYFIRVVSSSVRT